MSIKEKAPTKRELQARRTRKKIFDNAIELFSEYGFEKVTVEDITDKTGVSTGTFYVYFASKDSILLEQFRLIDEHYEEVAKQIPAGISKFDTVMKFMEQMCVFCSQTVGCSMMQIIYSNQCCPIRSTEIILKSDSRYIYKILRDVHKQGIQSGEFSADFDDDFFADMMMRAARGLIYDWCMANGEFDLIEEGKRYLAHTLKLYCA